MHETSRKISLRSLWKHMHDLSLHWNTSSLVCVLIPGFRIAQDTSSPEMGSFHALWSVSQARQSNHRGQWKIATKPALHVIMGVLHLINSFSIINSITLILAKVKADMQALLEVASISVSSCKWTLFST